MFKAVRLAISRRYLSLKRVDFNVVKQKKKRLLALCEIMLPQGA